MIKLFELILEVDFIVLVVELLKDLFEGLFWSAIFWIIIKIWRFSFRTWKNKIRDSLKRFFIEVGTAIMSACAGNAKFNYRKALKDRDEVIRKLMNEKRSGDEQTLPR